LEARAEEFKAAAMEFPANLGTWSLNETEKTLTLHVEGALVSNIEGTEKNGLSASLEMN
jgi:hypothetical protein